MLDVTVVFLNAGLPSTSIAPMEIFQYAGVLWNLLHGKPGEPYFRVRTVSLDGRPVQGAVPVAIRPNGSIADVRRTDLIVVPTAGMDIETLCREHAALIPWLQRWRKRGTAIAGICTGVSLLAEAGLLDGKPATTHWAVVEHCRNRYPDVLWRPELFITESDNIFCSGGLYSSVDLSEYLVEKYCGHRVAMELAKSLLIDTPRTWQSGYAIEPPKWAKGDEQIQKAQEWLFKNFRQSFRFADLAKRVGLTPRSFNRRFKAAAGHTPLDYLHRLRIDHAKQLLESEFKAVKDVGLAAGYYDLAFFRRLFKRFTGISPQEYRTRFGLKRRVRGTQRERGPRLAGVR
jgi:transcriptional regulator GlxA family with amidase domain